MMPDEEIVELYWQREERAIRETEKKYMRYLTEIAWNILFDREECRESVNDTWLGAWKSMPPHRPKILSVYLAKITRRISIDMLRKKRRYKRTPSEYTLSLSELDDCVSDGDRTQQEVDLHLLADSINRYLRTLSADARDTFTGRYFFADSVKEVASYCGMSEARAKSMLHRTRKGLKIWLEQEGFL